MIKLQDRDDFEVYVSNVGPATGGKKFFFTIPFDCWLKAMFAKLGAAGSTSGNLDVDINDGASSIFSGNPIRFAVDTVNPVYGALTTDPHPFTKGDQVDVTIDAIHGSQSIDLSVVLVFTRTRPAGVISGAVEVSVGKGL